LASQKTNGLSNPRLSPLAHAAAGAALLRTDEIALLCPAHPVAQRLASVAFDGVVQKFPQRRLRE
jgi:hypothetical protein